MQPPRQLWPVFRQGAENATMNSRCCAAIINSPWTSQWGHDSMPWRFCIACCCCGANYYILHKASPGIKRLISNRCLMFFFLRPFLHIFSPDFLYFLAASCNYGFFNLLAVDHTNLVLSRYCNPFMSYCLTPFIQLYIQLLLMQLASRQKLHLSFGTDLEPIPADIRWEVGQGLPMD